MDTGLSLCPFYMKSFLTMAILWLFMMRMWLIKLSSLDFLFIYFLLLADQTMYYDLFAGFSSEIIGVSHKWK